MEKYVKSTQEQATAAWIDYLNQLRIDELIRKLDMQDNSFEQAFLEIQKLKDFIGDPSHILGNDSTKHGEIAENVQVYISNARRLIEGLAKEYTFDGVGRTAPEDYLKNGQPVQSKFYGNPIGQNTFKAILKHLEDYPDFIKNGGTYEIPKEQYEKIIELLNKQSSQLSRSEAHLVKLIKEWEKANNVVFTDKIKPAIVQYKDVQQGTINDTIKKEEDSIKKFDKKRREEAYEKSKPSIKEAEKVIAISAALEGGVAFCLSIMEKRKSGKKLAEFTKEDWMDIGIDTGVNTAKGGIRGSVVYTLSNFTATPASVASGLVTATFGVIEQTMLLRNGKIDEEEFLINCEALSLDVSISTISSILGQIYIPIPILGALIGNVAGMYLYDIAKSQGLKYEQSIIINYKKEIEELTKKLDKQYEAILKQLEKHLISFKSMIDLAFDVDINIAFNGSIQLALFNGVKEEKILKTKKEIDEFFLL